MNSRIFAIKSIEAKRIEKTLSIGSRRQQRRCAQTAANRSIEKQRHRIAVNHKKFDVI